MFHILTFYYVYILKDRSNGSSYVDLDLILKKSSLKIGTLITTPIPFHVPHSSYLEGVTTHPSEGPQSRY